MAFVEMDFVSGSGRKLKCKELESITTSAKGAIASSVINLSATNTLILGIYIGYSDTSANLNYEVSKVGSNDKYMLNIYTIFEGIRTNLTDATVSLKIYYIEI